MVQVIKKFKLVKDALKIWNILTFGNIFQQAKKVGDKLQEMQNRMSIVGFSKDFF